MSIEKMKHSEGIGYKLKKVQHALRLQMDEELRSIGLTTPQYAVLSQLEMRPGISNAALARASFITPQTMHGIVVNLEKCKLVIRHKDPDHGRILCTKLTEKGAGIVSQAHKIVKEVDERMTRTMDKSKKNALQDLLIECLNNLNTIDFSFGSKK